MSETKSEQLQDSYKELMDKKELLFEKQQTISAQIKQTIDEIKKHRELRDEFTKKVQNEKKNRNDLNVQIKDLIVKIKEVQGDEQPVQQKQQKQQSYFSRDRSKKPLTFGQLKKQIEDLHLKIETEALPFDKEQQIMKLLKEKKKAIEQLDKQKSEKTESSKIGKDLSKLKKKSDKIHKSIQEAAQKSQEEHESLLSLSKEVDNLRSQEKDVRKSIDETKAELKKLRAVLKPSQTRRRVSMPRQPSRSNEEIEKRAGVVEEKLKGKKKLTTDDLLALQAMPVSKEEQQNSK